MLTPTPVAVAAEESDIRVIRANRLDDAVAQQIAALEPELGVIVAYGGLLREPLLSTPPLGWINLHFSLLPRWRGAAPVQRAIMAGDEITGATVFRLVEELDAGDVYGHFSQRIGSHETAGHLLDSLADGGAELLAGVVSALAEGTARAEPQRGDVTLAPKLRLADGLVDFAQHSSTVLSRIRGVTPEPGAFALLQGERFKIHQAAPAREHAPLAPGVLENRDGRVIVGTGDEPIELLEVQAAGKRAMLAAEWWRGRPASAPAAFDVDGAAVGS